MTSPADPLQIEDGGHLAGVPDALQRLWTPHRMAYVGVGVPPDEGCPFCVSPTRSDEDGLIVRRGDTSFVVMNLYPYNPGHLLVCPYRHVSDYTDLTEDETSEVAALTRTAMRVIRAVSAPAGFNLGMNQGEVAGAGIAAHLHQHIVPRWPGDSNFMTTVGGSRTMVMLLEESRDLFAAALAELD